MPVHVGSAVLVTGDTYEKKAKLLAIGRGPCREALQGRTGFGQLALRRILSGPEHAFGGS